MRALRGLKWENKMYKLKRSIFDSEIIRIYLLLFTYGYPLTQRTFASKASGGVRLFADQLFHYTILQKTTNEAFQAIWNEISCAA